MILRPRQEEFVKKSVVALQEHGNTLGIAPTGAGKTILFSAVTRKIINKKQKALILIFLHQFLMLKRSHLMVRRFLLWYKHYAGKIT
jgi:DNA repair protein RadD